MASYFLALNSATSSKTGNPFYTVSLLSVNQYGRWSGDDYFITKQTFDKISAKNFIPGIAVTLHFAGGGKLKGLSEDDSVAPLELVPDEDD